jgi:D-amino-acid dehydrogenase
VDAEAIKAGFLFAFSAPETAREAWLGQRELGAPLAGGVLEGAGLAELEPALGGSARAGFLVDDQWSVDPSLFVDRLVAKLLESGVEIVEGARVTSVSESSGGSRVHSVVGDFDADSTVIAAGVWSRELCRRLGADVELFPGNGYRFWVADPMPRRVIHLGDARVVFTPTGKRLRVAGTMEFDIDPDAFHPRRIDAILAAAGGYLKSADWAGRQDEWVGARVMTPDGLPAVGPVPGCSRVLLASGHNMLGLMLGPATGRVVTDLVLGAQDPALATALDPARLARRVRRSVALSG